jgi:hypothetical protein
VQIPHLNSEPVVAEHSFGVVVRPHERTRPHGRNAFSTSLFRRGGLRSTRATSRVSRPRCRDPMRWPSLRARYEARRLDGASTQQRDTLPSRSHAATIFLARIRDRSPRSNGMSNATVRILSDDPGPVEGFGGDSALTTRYWLSMWSIDGDGNLEPLPAAWTPLVCLDAPASICTRSGGVSTTSPKLRRIHVESCKLQ